MMKCGKNTKKIWDVIKSRLTIKFHSKPVYNQKFLEAKVT